MERSVSQIEEIPRKAISIPEISLKIINLNLNERGRSLTPPPQAPGTDSGALRRYGGQPVAKRRIHKLRSYNHIVRDLPLQPRASSATQGKGAPGGPCNGPYHDDKPIYIYFVRGMNNVMKGDKKQMLKTILEVLNEHAVSVARNEPVLLSTKKTSLNNQLHHSALHAALLALNETLDQGVLDISRSQLVGLGQLVTFILFFNKHLAQLGRHAWYSSYAQVLRDAWMGFGCLGAMVIMSSMRQ